MKYRSDGADRIAALEAEIARLTAERDYDRKQSEHKSSVIDKLNAVIASAAENAEAERDAALAGAWTMGRDVALQEVKMLRRVTSLPDNERAEAFDDCCDLLDGYIRALTPPADLAAKIGGE